MIGKTQHYFQPNYHPSQNQQNSIKQQQKGLIFELLMAQILNQQCNSLEKLHSEFENKNSKIFSTIEFDYLARISDEKLSQIWEIQLPRFSLP